MRIRLDEFGHETFDGQEQKAVTVGDSGAVIPDRNCGGGAEVEAGEDRRDVTFMGDAFGGSQHRGDLLERHAGMPMLGRTRRDVPSIGSYAQMSACIRRCGRPWMALWSSTCQWSNSKRVRFCAWTCARKISAP
jgi:hypothetical protein